MVRTLTKPRVETINGPAFAASYLINGDDSGITPQERESIDAWLTREGYRAADVVDCGESFFSRSFGFYFPEGDARGGDLVEYTLLIS